MVLPEAPKATTLLMGSAHPPFNNTESGVRGVNHRALTRIPDKWHAHRCQANPLPSRSTTAPKYFTPARQLAPSKGRETGMGGVTGRARGARGFCP